MAAPRVSIVVVSYNQAAFVDEALRGCVEQASDFPSLEIIVADDGSADGTRDTIAGWIERYPDLIRMVGGPENRGIAANFNTGMQAAQGEYLAWLGGDDIMLPGKIARQVAVLDADQAASGCYHDAEVFSWPGNETLGLFSRLYGGRAFSLTRVDAAAMLDPRVQMLPSTLLLRRARMPTAFDGRFRFHNDYLFDFEMIATGGPYVRMDGVLVRYRKHERSIGRDETVRATVLEENLMAMGLLTARFPRYAASIRKRVIYYLVLEALKNFHAGNDARARELLRAVKAQGAPLKALGLSVVGRRAAMLTDPRFRTIATKLRSILS
jgi:glycosyltransferase involved in cell wall biosynthesis